MAETVTNDGRGEARLRAAAERYCNWGRWGPDDEAGTTNFITAETVRSAGALIRQGNVFSLAIPFDERGPQKGGLRRFNAMSFMLRDGDDVASGSVIEAPGIGAADDVVIQATHGATHWDALAHIFYDGKMWNGYDSTLVSSLGAKRNGISSYRDRIVSRAVLLDIPRHMGVEWCELGQAITADQLDECARAERVELRRGDIVLVRLGHVAMCRAQGSWGDYAGGDAPGLDFDTAGWLFEREVGGVATDTWGVEVRPNQITFCNQPWHRVVIPRIGLLVGEIFDLEELSRDCAQDGRYEMFFSACPAPVTGSVGGPINPIAVK